MGVEGKKPVARQGPKLQEEGGDKLIGQNLREFWGRGATFIGRSESGEGRRTPPPFRVRAGGKEGLFEEA